MALEQGMAAIWYDTVDRIPIRVEIPVELTLLEAKTALEEFLDFVGKLADIPNADKITIGEACKFASDLENN